MMVEDHEKDVKEFENASKNATDPDLKAWAGKTLPTLQHHLEMAKATNAKVKARMPSRAAMRIVSRFEQASQRGGCGFCSGFGTTFRAGIEK